MGLKDFFFPEDLKVEKPLCRLDAAVQALERYYASAGNENTTGTYDDDSMIPQMTGVIMSKKKRKKAEASSDISIETQRQIRELIMGGTEGAYFTRDILKKATTALSHVSEQEGGAEKLRKIINVKFEADCEPTSPINATALEDDGVGIKAQTSVISTSTPESDSPAAAGGAATARVEETIHAPAGNDGSAEPNRLSNPCMSAILIGDHRLAPNNRRTSAASIFLNSIPTIEMSQCSPFVRLTFVTESDNFFDGLTQMSLVGFLGNQSSESMITFKNFSEGGFPDPHATPKDINMQEDTDIGINSTVSVGILPINGMSMTVGQIERKVAATGIELFTAPQTMTPLNSNAVNESIIDSTVPLATLQSLSVNIAGLGQSILANKTAGMEIMLHDRSRLPVLAPIIGATSYGSTYVMIEYGWSHPQAMGSNAGNVYADFLNSLRDRSIYNIQVADVNMQNDGQVKISLRLASRGTSAMNILPVGTGVRHVSARLIGPLMERLVAMQDRQAASQLQQSDDPAAATELREIMNGFSARISGIRAPQAVLPIETYRNILNVLNFRSDDNKRSGDPFAAMAAFVEVRRILDEAEEARSSEERYTTLSGEIESKRASIAKTDIFNDGNGSPSSQTQGASAKRDTNQQQAAGVQESAPQTDTSSANNGGSLNAPTLGAVVMSYVGTTLKSTFKHDEVQIMFYPFNRHAGSMADVNIAEFKLEGFGKFITNFKEQSPQKSTRVFFDELVDSECGPGNIEHTEFGLGTAYTTYNQGIQAVDAAVSAGTTSSSIATEEKNELRESLREDVEELLRTIYNDKPGNRMPKFEVPDITMLMENLDVKVLEDGANEKIDNTKNILRVHIFDAKAGIPYEADLLNTIVKGGSVANEILPESAYTEDTSTDGTTQGRTENASRSGENNQLSARVNEFLEDGSIRRTDGVLIGKASVVRYLSTVPVRKIKDAIKSVFPSITMGAQFTNVQRISMSSNTSGDVAQVLLFRSVSDSDTGENPSSVEDVFIVPTNATLNTAGFPLVSYGQKFYIDMGTNTTADNFYYVVGIKHNIGPGTFQTTINMAYNGAGTIRATRTALESVMNDQFPEVEADMGEVYVDLPDTSNIA